MNKIGKTIADLRKANNMTQSEVADILGVSYQAVSKWERDESLPDITLLPQIADLFHITIDELLRGSFEMNQQEIKEAVEIVEEVTDQNLNDQITELVNKEFETGNQEGNLPDTDSLAETISDLISKEFTESFGKAFDHLVPLMKPEKIKKVLKNRNVKFNIFPKHSYEYIDKETLENMIQAITEVDDEMYEMLTEVFPQCNSSAKDYIVNLLCESDLEPLDLSELMPLLNNGQKCQLMNHYFSTVDRSVVLDNMDELIVFMNSELKDQLVEFVSEGSVDEVCIDDLLVFLNSEQKDRIVEWIIFEDEEVDLDGLFPFLNSNQRDQLFDWAINKYDISTFEDYACHMSKEMIHKLVENYIDDENDDDLSDFYPFMSKATKNMLFTYYGENKMHDEMSELLPFMKV